MNLKQSVLTAALAATMAMASGQAAAYVYADSALSVDNLTIVITGGNVTVNSFGFTATNTATLNGVSDATQSANCGGLPGNNTCSAVSPALDPAPANAPGGTTVRTNNAGNPSELTSYGITAGNYSNSDSVINTAELVQLGSPTSTRQIAESLLNSGTSASANAEIQSVTGFELTFTVGSTADLTLNFDADPSLTAQILGELGSVFSQANLQTTFNLDRSDGAVSVSWTPDGTGTNNCSATGATCAETADTQDLARLVSISTNGTVSYSYDPNVLNLTHFGISITGLTAGTYTLALDAITSTQLRRANAVPEPGMLALLGIGLVGAFATTRRRRKSA